MPRIGLRAARPRRASLAHGGALTATTSANLPTNALTGIQVLSNSNAMVYADLLAQSAPFTLTLPAAQTSHTLYVGRQTPGQATTVQLVVTDHCGEWRSVVGGGPSAF